MSKELENQKLNYVTQAIIACLALERKSKMNCISACGQTDTDSILNNIIV